MGRGPRSSGGLERIDRGEHTELLVSASSGLHLCNRRARDNPVREKNNVLVFFLKENEIIFTPI